MNKFTLLIATSLAVTAAIPAYASSTDGKCGAVTGKWMNADAAKSVAAKNGFEARRVKREDGCLEIYAIDKNGARVELYMNPVTGKIIRTKRKS